MAATHTNTVKVTDSLGATVTQSFTWVLAPAAGPVGGGFAGDLYANGIQSSAETQGCCPKTAAEIANERVIDDHIALSYSGAVLTAPTVAGFPGEAKINIFTGEYWVYNYPGTWAYYAPKKGLTIINEANNGMRVNSGSSWLALIT